MDEFMTVNETAARLGVPARVVYRLIDNRRIPFINVGSGNKKGRYLIPVDAFNKWIDRQLQEFEGDLWKTE